MKGVDAMSALLNEAADGADGAVTTPTATAVRASAAALSKEDERRRQLLEWQESKASGKKGAAPERKTVPDRKAQFFERRERRLEEEKKKRMSRSGKENSSTPTTAVSETRVAPSLFKTRSKSSHMCPSTTPTTVLYSCCLTTRALAISLFSSLSLSRSNPRLFSLFLPAPHHGRYPALRCRRHRRRWCSSRAHVLVRPVLSTRSHFPCLNQDQSKEQGDPFRGHQQTLVDPSAGVSPDRSRTTHWHHTSLGRERPATQSTGKRTRYPLCGRFWVTWQRRAHLFIRCVS